MCLAVKPGIGPLPASIHSAFVPASLLVTSVALYACGPSGPLALAWNGPSVPHVLFEPEKSYPLVRA
jgi:hypothetical protein